MASEKARIERAGGHVSSNGRLAGAAVLHTRQEVNSSMMIISAARERLLGSCVRLAMQQPTRL